MGSAALVFLALHAVLLLVVFTNLIISIVSDTYRDVKRWAFIALKCYSPCCA